MLFRVAAQAGQWDVDALARAMPAALFDEWCAFYDLEPWGFQADAWRSGVVAATVANYAGRTRKKSDAKPSDFMPRKKRQKRAQTALEIKHALAGTGSNDG